MNRHGRLYLVCYDICDPKRLSRVARFLCRHACRVQYSVFVMEATPAQLSGVLSDLDEMIDPAVDDVRAYPLPWECEASMLGRQLFPEDVLLVRHGRNVLRLGVLAKRGPDLAAQDGDWH